jgi:RNA polymerase sigma-70 factor (ECF subfamily)
LFDKYGQRLFNVVNHLVGDFEEAHDITQEAFVKAYQAIESFNFRSEFYTWLYRIGVNQARDHLRRRKHQLPTRPFNENAFSPSVKPPTGEAASESNRLHLQQTIDRILESLNPQQREILTLREIEGFSYAEIAEILGLSLGTVKSKLARTRADIRHRFGAAKDILKEETVE